MMVLRLLVLIGYACTYKVSDLPEGEPVLFSLRTGQETVDVFETFSDL